MMAIVLIYYGLDLPAQCNGETLKLIYVTRHKKRVIVHQNINFEILGDFT